MSATVRYDIGHQAAVAIAGVNLGAFAGLNLHDVRRWQGVGRGYRECQCFSVSLPRQAGPAVFLITAALEAAGNVKLPGLATRGCRTLAVNLTAALGLPPDWCVLPPQREAGFLDAIGEDPRDLAHWMAYADWLSEQPGAYEQARGTLIAGWLGKGAIKVKNGTLPLLAVEAERIRTRGRG